MSQWTYVTGAVRFDTYGRSDAESLYIAQTAINHLPLVTGSERNASLYVNLEKGATASDDCDEFGRPSNLGNEWNFGGRPSFSYQTRCVMTITGDLRDRDLATTAREVARMLARLATKVEITDCSVTVSDMYGGRNHRVTFDNAEWLHQIDVKTDISEPSWRQDRNTQDDKEESS